MAQSQNLPFISLHVYFLLLTILATLLTAVNGRQYTVVNNCPISLRLFIGSTASAKPLTTGETITGDFGIDAGFFYTDANGGSPGTRAGFYDDNNSYMYYIVKDLDHFNIGMRIAPNKLASNGFCPTVTCDAVSCSTAFTQPPTRFPPPQSTPPAPPVFSCPFASVEYTITFCPSGSLPDDTALGAPVHPNYDDEKCMDVRGANFANGTPVQIYDCNGTPAQKWIFSKGSTSVRVAGTNYCLDAGSTPANGVGMKIWQCYDNLPAQEWYFTDLNHIALPGTALCLDLTNGVLTNSNQLQTWQCASNDNQVWTKQ